LIHEIVHYIYKRGRCLSIGSNLENVLSFKLRNHFTINYKNSRVMMNFFL